MISALNLNGMPWYLRHLLRVLLLLVVFTFNFAHQGGSDSAQAPGDDATYIQSAYDYWQSGAYPGAITWSPSYVQLMSPFVGVLGKEAGYKTWRYLLFAANCLMVYAVFTKMFGSAWMAAVLALFSQLFLMPYLAPSLQMLVCLLYLVGLLLLSGKARSIGFVFAILLNGIFISGVMSFVLFAFGALCLVFYRRLIFSRRFLVQVLCGLVLFVAVLHHFKYDVSKYSEEAAQRGRAGLYHQLSIYIVKSGRVAPYLDAVSSQENFSTEDARYRKVIDHYYLEKFGANENDLRAVRHDARWPLFLLDWPWLLEKDPQLMHEYMREVLKTAVISVAGSFQIVDPFRPYRLDDYKVVGVGSIIWRGVFNVVAVLLLLAALILPDVVRRDRGQSKTSLVWPSHLQLLFLLSTVAPIVPLMLVKPLPIYFPPFIPAYLVALAFFGRKLSGGLQRVVPAK